MALRIEDYAIIGNGSTAALVGKNGSIDWLCFPRFDSGACFAALLGSAENGYWRIAPTDQHATVTRRYQPGTLVLETEFTTSTGSVVLIDCMDHRSGDQDVLRLVRGKSGRVDMQLELVIRFEYGSVVPWVMRAPDGRLQASAGPDRLTMHTPVELEGRNMHTQASFSVSEGEEIPFALTWSPSFQKVVTSPDVCTAIDTVKHTWEKWSSHYRDGNPWAEAVLRSAITLKALSHHQTGGIVAAVTTSLPEQLGGERNWDYRYCWLRDATFTLYALMESGFREEAKAWREWLLRAIAGDPAQMQIMYGIAGERRLTEFEVPWLSGYEASQPVRIGNAASEQLQLDVFGEVLDSLYQARRMGLEDSEPTWDLEMALLSRVEKIWSQPDEGIWEVRGGAKHFTHSKVMTWVAVDRAVRTVEQFGKQGPVDKWRKLREQIHAEVCEKGFNAKLNSFTQYFGGTDLDASCLLLPLVGFLPPEDPRIKGTIKAIEQNLFQNGLVKRYNTTSSVDGLHGSEGVFLPCSFWLVDNYVLQKREREATELFESLLALRNDVGLLSEEYDVTAKRQVGNFPQAFSHLALVNAAHNLHREDKPALHRSRCVHA
jgi:GH15 family glucan-1,4-alpha-glucosidase